jgi:hypothetical protein
MSVRASGLLSRLPAFSCSFILLTPLHTILIISKHTDFRSAVLLKPFKSFEALTGGDQDAIKALTEVHGRDGIEYVDLLVGTTLAEPKVEGFAISEQIRCYVFL